MKICVLNGSPKGEYSVTLQTVRYLENLCSACTFDVIHVGQRIKSLEKDLTPALTSLVQADVILFSYPVYTFIAPSQLHRFIELLKESGIDLTGKFAAQITTSKHFYDVTAHAYIRDNCFDLGLKYIGGLSADMDDLLTEQGQKDARAFLKYLRFCVKNNIFATPAAKTGTTDRPYTPTLPEIPKTSANETVIVTNQTPADTALAGMIADFRAAYPYPTRVINIAEYPFSGGCLGCFHCATDGTCIYKDNFDRFLREEIQTASAIVYAFSIKDHSMGATFKRYDDRQFCNGHRTVTMGMPMGYLIHGDLSAEPNLAAIIEARCDVGHNFLAGCAEDTQGILDLAKKLEYALENKLTLPQNFYGVGGLKIFRDLIYVMRGMMKADHEFYKAHSFYDFPQKQQGTVLKMKLVGALLANPKVKAKMGNSMNDGMIAPYKKVVKKAKRNPCKPSVK